MRRLHASNCWMLASWNYGQISHATYAYSSPDTLIKLFARLLVSSSVNGPSH